MQVSITLGRVQLTFCSDICPTDIFHIWVNILNIHYIQWKNKKELPECDSPHQIWTSDIGRNELRPNIPLTQMELTVTSSDEDTFLVDLDA